jgi:hypothetical protein
MCVGLLHCLKKVDMLGLVVSVTQTQISACSSHMLQPDCLMWGKQPAARWGGKPVHPLAMSMNPPSWTRPLDPHTHWLYRVREDDIVTSCTSSAVSDSYYFVDLLAHFIHQHVSTQKEINPDLQCRLTMDLRQGQDRSFGRDALTKILILGRLSIMFNIHWSQHPGFSLALHQ